MSRNLTGELVVTGTLATESALSVASGLDAPDADITCVRNGAAQLIIPGSALAGAFRATFEHDKPWGGQEWASQLYFEDAVLIGDDRVEHRDGVMIDRRTGAAAEKMLYGREVVPAGSRFAWELRFEVTDGFDRSAADDWLNRIANRLADGVSFGGATAAGLGRVKLIKATTSWIGTRNRAELLEFLGAPNAQTTPITLKPTPPVGHLRITVPWRALGPLLVSVPLNGIVDRIPQHTRDADGATKLVIPGTSLKGVLRSRAEWIVRTVADVDAPEAPLAQLASPLGPVLQLFGIPPAGRGKARRPGRQGALRVGEVLSKNPVGGWSAIINTLVKERSTQAGDQGLTERARVKAAAMNQLRQSSGGLRINDHVAISRWTGGADDGKLFADVAPLPQADYWQPIELDLDLGRIQGDVLAALALLAFVLRDFCHGWVGIGHGTTRGYGEVIAAPQDITWSVGSSVPGVLSEWASRSFALDELLGSDDLAGLRGQLETAWLNAVSQLSETKEAVDAVID